MRTLLENLPLFFIQAGESTVIFHRKRCSISREAAV
jgi:hypothetical protein